MRYCPNCDLSQNNDGAGLAPFTYSGQLEYLERQFRDVSITVLRVLLSQVDAISISTNNPDLPDFPFERVKTLTERE